ncbi:MAG: cysteine desulfurase [Lachnospiraceae bacterium]|nr:cysteine desulfurase [Lachnospiraceae bacterium]
MESVIYLDYAATTPMREEVFQAMKPYMTKEFGNPSSAYSLGRTAREAVNSARKIIADSIGAKENEIYFTSGGTEADNWAVKGTYRKALLEGRHCHIITDEIEHHAVLHTCKALEDIGCEVTYLPVDDTGKVNPAMLERSIRKDTALVSVMMANNEIGTIQPISELSKIAKRHNILLHVDAVQAYGHMPINVDELGIDMMSVSAHKLYGPKGIGFLYVREGILDEALLNGGSQEMGMRAGTENVAAIVGLGEAVRLAMQELYDEAERERKLRDYFIDRVTAEIPYVRLNGAYGAGRLANNINFSFSFVESESLLIMLDMKGICISAGSACATGSKSPSHVLTAIGLPTNLANGSIRLTLGRSTTKEELDTAFNAIKEAVLALREVSIQYEDFTKGQQVNENRRILY